MQKIVLDTNVLVSSLIQRGYPFLIVHQLVFDKKIQLCISEELMVEYREVLNRRKFSKYPDFMINAEKMLDFIEMTAVEFHPKIKLKILSDEDDNKVLELASACRADFLVTGNTNDFTMEKYKKTVIVTPKEYWEQRGSILI